MERGGEQGGEDMHLAEAIVEGKGLNTELLHPLQLLLVEIFQLVPGWWRWKLERSMVGVRQGGRKGRVSRWMMVEG